MANTVQVIDGAPRTVAVIDLQTPYFEQVVVPTVGLGNVVEGYKFDEASGFGTAIGVLGVQDATAGTEITQGLATGVVARPVAADIARANPGDAFTAANAVFDFDARATPFSVVMWAKMDGLFSAGMFGKSALESGPGYQAILRPDVNPDQMQWRVRDGVLIFMVAIVNNAVSDDAWHMWTFVNDPSVPEVRLHLDKDAPAATSTVGLGDTRNAGALLIGDNLSGLSMQGDVNHFYVCSTALNQTQVDALFDGGQ